MTAALNKKSSAVKEEIKDDVGQCCDMAITHDSWTSLNTDSFNTVTTHFITETWELLSVVLQTTKMVGSHTAENIASDLQKAQAMWKLPTPTAVTGNAANEHKAFKLLKWVHFGCYGHQINLTVKYGLDVPKVALLQTCSMQSKNFS